MPVNPLFPLLHATLSYLLRPATTLTLTSKQGSTTTGSITTTNASSMSSDLDSKFTLAVSNICGMVGAAVVFGMKGATKAAMVACVWHCCCAPSQQPSQ